MLHAIGSPCPKCGTKLQQTYEPYESRCPGCGFWWDNWTQSEVTFNDAERYNLGDINDVRQIVTGENFSNDGMDEDGTCPLCCGDGKYDLDPEAPCPNCNGTGKVW